MIFNYLVYIIIYCIIYNYILYNNYYILYIISITWFLYIMYNRPVNHTVLIFIYNTMLSSECWVGNNKVHRQIVAGMTIGMCKGLEMERWKEGSRNWRKGRESMSWRERVRVLHYEAGEARHGGVCTPQSDL